MDATALDQLAQVAATGDESAFTQLVEATEYEIRAFVSARAIHASMVEEVVQATYVTTFSILNRYEPRGTLMSWLKGIARNRLNEELRRLRQHQPLADDLADQLMIDDSSSISDDEETDGLAAQRLRDCLDRLSPRTRQLIQYRYWHDQSLVELAERVQQPATNLAALLYRARKALFNCLEGRPS